jgi:outer membrane lipoprotein-sorting protein
VIYWLLLACWIGLRGVVMAAPMEPMDALGRWLDAQSGIVSVEATFVQTRELPALRMPLRSEGRVWLAKGGLFRWEVGNPASVVVLRTPEGAWIGWPRRRAFQSVDAGRSGDHPWIEALEFPGGMGRDEFHRRFEILGASIDEAGVCRLELLPRDPQARAFLKSMALRFVVDGGRVVDFEVRLKDGSALRNEFREVRLNGPVDRGIFRIDTTGWLEAEQ